MHCVSKKNQLLMKYLSYKAFTRFLPLDLVFHFWLCLYFRMFLCYWFETFWFSLKWTQYVKALPYYNCQNNISKWKPAICCLSDSFTSDTCIFIKKETLARVFSCEFCKLFKNNFFTEYIWTTASKALEE